MPENNNNLILKVLVGSRAHGLHNDDSDYDYRGVYVTPTKEILSLNYQYKGSHWFEGKEDQTTYEIQHFLELALHCNPTILEVFVAPTWGCNPGVRIDTTYGRALRGLFPYIWEPKRAFDAFTGYGLNQRKKMLDNKDNRSRKYAVAYLRTLWNLYDLLTEGTFKLQVTNEAFKQELLEIKNGAGWLNIGYIINRAETLTNLAEERLRFCKQKADPDKVNQFLIKVREDYFNG
jgi:hypothetical protein